MGTETEWGDELPEVGSEAGQREVKEAHQPRQLTVQALHDDSPPVIFMAIWNNNFWRF
jgi:hypothetical protein